MSLYLYFLPPILAVIYKWLEYAGIIDKLTGRGLALDGLKRLRSTSGYPKAWIYNKDQDEKIFRAIEKRISKNTDQPIIISAIKNGFKPNLISVGGKPTEIEGLPTEWPQAERFSYLPNQPVLYFFEVPKSKTGTKCDRACTLDELDGWLKEEKDNRTFWLGTFLLGVISITFLLVRLNIA